MNGAKIRLSALEMELVQNSNWILTKRAIIEKVYELFGQLANEYTSAVTAHKSFFPAGVIAVAPKISKGENYHGLPYVMLDYPRYFDKENVFAIRTFFWWGNFFSSTLHLKGKYKTAFEKNIVANYDLLIKHNYSLCISNDEWDFRFTENNYQPVASLNKNDREKIIVTSEFIKLSAKMPLSQWEYTNDEMLRLFKVELQSAGINFPGGEINL
jgi:hypothetical protein